MLEDGQATHGPAARRASRLAAADAAGPQLRRRGRWLARIAVLEDALSTMSPGPGQNDSRWGKLCRHLQALRSYHASRPQSPDATQEIEAIDALEKRIQAINPSTVDLRTVHEILSRHLEIYLKVLREYRRGNGQTNDISQNAIVHTHVAPPTWPDS